MTTQTVGGRIYEFGLTDRLRIAREQAGYGQREFAEASGISRSSITNYENGITTPRRPQLAAWAMATGFSLEWLQTGENPHQDRGPDGGEGLPRLDSNQQPAGSAGSPQFNCYPLRLAA